MSVLSLDSFLSAGSDFEQTRYQILGALRQIRRQFAQNIIYPHLDQLVELQESLRQILTQFDELRQALPGELTGIDLEAHRLLYNRPEKGEGSLGRIEELIAWALPLIQDAIDEGRTICEFVEENLHVEEVGLVPSYVEEGYVIVPDRREQCLHILQYTLSIFTRADERYRSLRTTLVKTIPHQRIELPPGGIKLALMEERRELPNPATFFVESVLDFPFEPTLLPVAKRKLLRHLFDQRGTA